MPTWAGYWKGGRFYVDNQGRRVFFIERRRRVIKLDTHDPDLALGELALFWAGPEAYKPASAAPPATPPGREGPVYVTAGRVALYLEAIRGAVKDHRRARASYLEAWGKLGLDLRTADRAALRRALATFDGGHAGRVEALNAFARFLVKEGDLASWRPLVNTQEADPENARAPRVAYSVDQIRAAWKGLGGLVADVFRVRVSTGLHHTEIEQVAGLVPSESPLPDVGPGLRLLPPGQRIAGVVQVVHRKKSKTERRHRVSLDAETLAALVRLTARVPDRITMWETLGAVGVVPSNLRHTFTTLAGEVGAWVTYKTGGVDRARVAQVLGHRAGSTMTADRYDRAQVPPMIVLPLKLT